MISIIICSRAKIIPTVFLENIKKTIGIDYELIVIDNSENQYSMFQAYNLGIKKSKGDYWCFLHDDIMFHTQNWGAKIQEIFKGDRQIGLIGVAGAKIKTKMPSAWWDCPYELMVTNLIHKSPNNQKEKQYHGFDGKNNIEVAVVDGVFMAARANKLISFDNTLKGFHHYDLNLALQYVKQQLKIVVTNQVLIEHFSIGKINRSWFESALTFNRHYCKMLPLNPVNSCSVNQLKILEFNNGKSFCEKLIKYNLKKSAILYWLRLWKQKPWSKFHFHFFKKLINN